MSASHVDRLTRPKGISSLVVGLACALLLCACGTRVTRTDADESIDLSGYWNDTDSRVVAEKMIHDAANSDWAEAFSAARGRTPTLIVGGVRNLTHEHLDTATFVKDLEREWVNSGRVRLVAAPDEREMLRDERLDQARHASLETAKSMGRELGADFMLVGQIHSILDSADGKTLRFYQVELEVVDLETNEKVWIGQEKLKKIVSRGRVRF
jgi:uncharacterized protein (TIGR02722 family)